MNDEAITAFLQEIVRAVDEKKINSNQRYLLGELYLKFNFFSLIPLADLREQEIEAPITEIEHSMLNTVQSERRFINFMLLGWYLFIVSELSQQN